MFRQPVLELVCRPSREELAVSIAVQDFRALVRCRDLDLLAYLLDVFPESCWGVPEDWENAVEYDVHVAPGRSGVHRLLREGRLAASTGSWEELFLTLESDITLSAARSLGTRYHLVHAGAVASGNFGLLLPAASGSGKSTLVAALAVNGLECLSDEFAVLTGRGGLIDFPKAISLNKRGWRALEKTYSHLAAFCMHGRNGNAVVHVATSGRHDRNGAYAGYPVQLVIAPKYRPRVQASLKPLAKSAALATLVEQSMNLAIRGESGFQVLARLVQTADCYSLTYSDISSAVNLVRSLLTAEK